MALSACFFYPQIPPKIKYGSGKTIRSQLIAQKDPKLPSSFTSGATELSGQRVGREGANLRTGWSFLGSSRTAVQPNNARFVNNRNGFAIRASWLTSTQIASSVIPWCTASVLPFYLLMVVAPKAQLTMKLMKSTIPYFVLGLLYAFLMYLSWTPESISLLSGGNNYLPELDGLAKLFTNKMTLASAWVHWLAIDLFAARQVFHDGLENGVETRHSVSLCMLCCPIGVLTHVITKSLTKVAKSSNRHM